MSTNPYPSSSSQSEPAKPRTRLAGLNTDPAFQAISAPELRHRILISHAAERVRQLSQRYIGLPVGRVALGTWLRNGPGAARVERFGLPYHVVLEAVKPRALMLEVDPRQLIQMSELPPRGSSERPSALSFIWDGDWDLHRNDLRGAFWLEYMRDLDENRGHLERTLEFKKHMAAIEAGKPTREHRSGMFLNTPERIIQYLKVYLAFLDEMGSHGYQADRPSSGIGVLVSRDGRLLKTRKGMHRTAMAQWVGLPRIPVEVRHVHRDWWNKVTAGCTGREALDRMVHALKDCTPETRPGPMDALPPFVMPDHFWPAPKHAAHRPD